MYKCNEINTHLINLMMINRIWRLNSQGRFNFSSAPAPLTDWEYISKIQNSIKHSNINEALRYLVNSHLDGKVLDMQVFRNLYLKIHETKAGLTYEEIVYKLYRQHFKPHILILDWMNSLARSNNPTIVRLLQQDYHMLKIDMPKVDKIQQQDEDNTTILKLSTAKKNQLAANLATTTVTKHTVNTNNKIIKVNQKNEEKQQQSKQIHSFPPMQIGEKNLNQQNINKLIYGLLGMTPKIVIHNVEVEYHNYDDFDEGDGHEAQQSHEYMNEDKLDDQDILDYNCLKKIKIGKIQIITSPGSEPFFPNELEPGKNPKE